MSVVVWAVVVAAAGIGLAVVAVRPGPGRQPVEGELPATPLQRLALRSLGLAVALSGLLVGLVAVFGVDRTELDASVRIGFELVLVAILGVFLVMTIRISGWLRREDGTVDERDLRILGGSHGVASAAILLTLAIWQIVLVERYHAIGQIPVSYLYMIFWSCVVVGLVAMPLGILIGYRRA